jgi:hypothetical protein
MANKYVKSYSVFQYSGKWKLSPQEILYTPSIMAKIIKPENTKY